MVNKDKKLGRGLGALLSSGADDDKVVVLDINKITPRKEQPRKQFSPEKLEELALSIKNHGVLQPVIVRAANGAYELIAGERRLRAAKIAELEKIPALIMEVSDLEAAEMSLVENLQRDDLNIVEEAQAYKQLMEQFNYNQEQMSERVGKSRSHVANALRTLSLPEEIQILISEGKISAGHARALIGLKPDEQVRFVYDITRNKLSVRTIEQIIKFEKEKKKERPAEKGEILGLQNQLQNLFSTKVKIIERRQGGKIEIEYFNEEDLERIAELLGITI